MTLSDRVSYRKKALENAIWGLASAILDLVFKANFAVCDDELLKDRSVSELRIYLSFCKV